MGGRAAAGIATQTFGGGKGRIDLDAISDLSMTRGGWPSRRGGPTAQGRKRAFLTSKSPDGNY
ncbi:MAG: hypothetical protein ABSF90_10805 [Syntrophobacteraceae bacterium]